MKAIHFTKEILNNVKDKQLKFLFTSETGAMGPSGLVMAYYGGDEIYVAQIKRKNEEGYKELLDCIFDTLKANKNALVGKEKNSYSYKYLGAGNDLYIKKYLAAQYKIDSFSKAFDYFKKIGFDKSVLEEAKNSMDWKIN